MKFAWFDVVKGEDIIKGKTDLSCIVMTQYEASKFDGIFRRLSKWCHTNSREEFQVNFPKSELFETTTDGMH